MKQSTNIWDAMTDQVLPTSMPPRTGADKSKEKTFEISLPALVKGKNADGRIFEEKTEIARISSEEAIFRLNQKVLVDTPLNLTLSIPRTLILGNDLNLSLSGTVLCAAVSNGGVGAQTVALRLNRNFSIRPLSS
jgi:hypothetical protein